MWGFVPLQCSKIPPTLQRKIKLDAVMSQLYPHPCESVIPAPLRNAPLFLPGLDQPLYEAMCVFRKGGGKLNALIEQGKLTENRHWTSYPAQTQFSLSPPPSPLLYF